jgi:hypothetical protein
MTLPTSPALTYSIGRVDHPPTYYEVLTPAAGSTKPPVVMIHGGAHTGACYLATPDGRQGWGHVFGAQVTGTNDLGHAREVDEPIADWLNANGAEADFIYLGDLGINGNGHMLMLERNSDALAQLIIDWIES